MHHTALHHKLARTTSHLTCRELYRLLYRYDLAPIAKEAIWDDLDEDAAMAAEVGAETGCYRRTPMEQWLSANPVYGPIACPAPAWDPDGDVPF